MAQIMLYAPPPGETEIAFRTGGRPLAPPDIAWPTCQNCNGAMQFIGQIPLDGKRLMLIFMCQNDPGLCDEWDADGGGNKALVVSTQGLQLLEPPETGETLLGEISGCTFGPKEGRSGGNRALLGQMGGEPEWIQGDETPKCDDCEQQMRFVAMLEEGHNHKTAANYGGGAAYAFCCDPCSKAKFLWQQ